MPRSLHSSAVWVAIALALAPPAVARAAQPAAAFQFDLPAMELSEALRRVATMSGTNLVAPGPLLAGRKSPPLRGEMTAEAAVEALLEDSGLVAEQAGTSLVIRSTTEAPPTSSAAEQRPETIVVTGTHVRGAPPTSPLITVSRRQIEEAAPASVEELMRTVPQNLSAGVAQENFGVTGTGADITQHGAGVNLRGLGQRATLVLVDGRRVAPSGTGSFVDVSLIPVASLQHVEVLTDGASAIYGSDAVAGVVNFILRDDLRGIEPLVQLGTSRQGGGDQLLASVTGGAGWTGGHGLLSYEYRDQSPIRAGQRDFPINLPDAWSLVPSEKRHSLFGTARQQLAEGVTLDLLGMYSNRTTDRSFFMAGPALPVNQHARGQFFGGTAALGVALGAWHAEASASYSGTRDRQEENQPAGQGFFNRYVTRNDILEFGLKADGALLELPGGAAKLAVGAGFRRETFAGVFSSPVNLPLPQQGARNILSAYGELLVPVFSPINRRPGFEALTLSAAGRFERYEGLGSTFNPKFGALWSPVNGLTLRSSYATSFRAPLLSETLGIYNIFLFPAALLYVDPATAPPGVGAALLGNDPDVRPERSRSFSAGAEIAPPSVPGLKLTATYYAIRFTNRIALPTDQVVVVGDPALEPIVIRNPDLASVTGLFAGAGQVVDVSGPGFTPGGATPGDVVVIVDARTSNTAETRTSGLDLGASYAFEAGPHKLRFDLNASRVFKFDDRLTSASPLIRTLNRPFHPIGWRARSGASWSYGPFSAFVFINYTGAYRDRRAGRSLPVQSWTTFDGGVAFAGTAENGPLLDKLRVALNVQNLFDRDPPRLLPEPGFTRDIGYDPVNASGRGRTVSLQIRRSW